jgi:hypothetical protein
MRRAFVAGGGVAATTALLDMSKTRAAKSGKRGTIDKHVTAHYNCCELLKRTHTFAAADGDSDAGDATAGVSERVDCKDLFWDDLVMPRFEAWSAPLDEKAKDAKLASM